MIRYEQRRRRRSRRSGCACAAAPALEGLGSRAAPRSGSWLAAASGSGSPRSGSGSAAAAARLRARTVRVLPRLGRSGSAAAPLRLGQASTTGASTASCSSDRSAGSLDHRRRRPDLIASQLRARRDRQLDAPVAEVRRQRAEVGDRVSHREADVVVGRRERHDARGAPRPSGGTTSSSSGSCSWSRSPTNGQAGAERRERGASSLTPAAGRRWTSMTARPSSTPRT